MRIIEAVWEKRNLGVTCIEAEIEPDDDPADVVAAMNSRDEQYLVAKVAARNYPAIAALQKEGFTFIESLIRTEIDLSKGAFIPEKCRRLVKNIGWHEASAEEIEKTLAVIRKGDIFSTDRISVDPYFSREAAGIRYAYWIEDILSAGNSELMISEYLGENVGFTVIQHKETYSAPALSGLYPEYLGSGMGFAVIYSVQSYLYNKGVKRTISHISTNNADILDLAAMFRYRFGDVRNILAKHQ